MLQNKTALITGASRGIGRAIAQLYAKNGCHVAFTDLCHDENVVSLIQEIESHGVKAHFIASNAADFEAAHAVVEEVVNIFGKLDILVCNAGITRDTLLMRMNEQQWDSVLEVNLKSVFNYCHAATPQMMRQRSGRIIAMSSVVGIGGNAGQANYAASKAGIIGFIKSLSKELGSRNIRANAIAPGFILTDQNRSLLTNPDGSLTPRAQTIIAHTPFGRFLEPEELLGTLHWLASDASKAVTGTVAVVDGGFEIDIWGGQRRLIESNYAMLKAAGANLDNVKLVLISEVALKYIYWRLYQKLVEDTKINIENQTQIYETIKSKYLAGLVDELTLNQAESLVKSSKQKLPSFVLSEKNMLNALALLIGVLPSEIINKQSTILENEPNFDINSLYDISANIVQTRPDVYSAEQQLIAQNALIGNKMSNLLPSLSLQSFLGYQNNTLSPIIAKDYNMYSSNVQTLLPLFHWGKIVNDIKLQQSVTKEALSSYQSALLQAVVDISNAIASVEQNSKNAKLTNENFILYQNIADLSKRKYDSGLIAFSDLLDAQNNKISAQIAKNQAKANMLEGIISFYKSVGGGLSANYSVPGDRKALTTSVREPCKD